MMLRRMPATVAALAALMAGASAFTPPGIITGR